MKINSILEQLTDTIRSRGTDGICLAFSGGVDSAVLLKIISGLKLPAATVTFQTFLHPQPETVEARRLAKQAGVTHHLIAVNELDDPNIIQNPADRCYHCKRMLFDSLCDYAAAQGLGCVMDGTNADDLLEYRPGLKALKECDVFSPLAACGITKEQVRAIAAHLGLETASKPSTPCLATRFPYGEMLTVPKLEQVEKAEGFLKKLGFGQLRVRSHQGTARIELRQEEFGTLLSQAGTITAHLKGLGFDYVTLDLEGFRSGSMDIHLKKKAQSKNT